MKVNIYIDLLVQFINAIGFVPTLLLVLSNTGQAKNTVLVKRWHIKSSWSPTNLQHFLHRWDNVNLKKTHFIR